jgi:hypothetical protein
MQQNSKGKKIPNKLVKTLLWKECPTKCLIETSNNEIRNEDAYEVMEHFL